MVKPSAMPALKRKPREVMDKLTAAVRRKIRRRAHGGKRRGPHEALLGFRRFVANPKRFGGFVSGPALAEAITREIDPAAGLVIELGPGTGVFTRALLARGVAEQDLVLIEADALLAARLRGAFPAALVLHCDAASVTAADLPAGCRPAATVSGLPLLNFAPSEVERIIETVFALLAPGAAFHQFTYGPRCPVRDGTLARHGLAGQRTARVWRNVPPATVYRITRS